MLLLVFEQRILDPAHCDFDAPLDFKIDFRGHRFAQGGEHLDAEFLQFIARFLPHLKFVGAELGDELFHDLG